MKCLVTGAAGFVGSHLCEYLLHEGHAVVGLDAFIPYYPRAVKEANLATAWRHPAFVFHERDLRFDPLRDALDGVEVVFHLAAMPGLPASWTDFDLYQSCNLQGTQRLLEALRSRTGLMDTIGLDRQRHRIAIRVVLRPRIGNGQRDVPGE